MSEPSIKQRKNVRRIALILEGILVVAVLSLTIFALSEAAQTKKTQPVTQQSPVPSASPSLATSPTPTPSSQPAITRYLLIKELGIKLPLTSSIQDLVYTYTPVAAAESSLNFSTTSISSTPASGTSCSAANRPLGSYDVYATRQTNVGGGDSQAGILVAAINGHFIYYHHVQYACGDSPADQNQVSALISPLYTAVQNAQIAP